VLLFIVILNCDTTSQVWGLVTSGDLHVGIVRGGGLGCESDRWKGFEGGNLSVSVFKLHLKLSRKVYIVRIKIVYYPRKKE